MDEPIELDILDVCNLLQVVGFKVKDVYKESNVFQEKSGKKVHLKCNASGINVILESSPIECNCPQFNENDENGKWETTWTSGGVQDSKTENNSSFRKGLISNVAAHVKAELLKLVTLTRQKTMDMLSPPKIQQNLSVSSTCLSASKRDSAQVNSDMSNRYRSLDTLSMADRKSDVLPEPRLLSASQKSLLVESNLEIENMDDNKSDRSATQKPIVRQNTYTASPTEQQNVPEIVAPARTSSPIQMGLTSVRMNLYEAINLLHDSIKTMESGLDIDNKSVCGINVSHISVKPTEPRPRSASTASTRSRIPYASSPNLGRIQESSTRNSPTALKRRLSSYQTSPTALRSTLKTNSLMRSIPKKISAISPTFSLAGSKKYSSELGTDVLGTYKSKMEKSPHPVLGPRTGIRASSSGALGKEGEPKKKNSLYSHIKSTIPRNFSSMKK